MAKRNLLAVLEDWTLFEISAPWSLEPTVVVRTLWRQSDTLLSSTQRPLPPKSDTILPVNALSNSLRFVTGKVHRSRARPGAFVVVVIGYGDTSYRATGKNSSKDASWTSR